MTLTRRKIIIAISIIVLIVGIGSRIIHIGWPIWDKYMGDALYAILLYLLLCLLWNNVRPGIIASITTVLMLAIETFQLTGFALSLSSSSNIILKLLSIVLGTTFGWPDLVAYLIGILGIYWVDRHLVWPRRRIEH